MIRTGETANLPLKSQRVPLLLIHKGELTEAQGVMDKRKLLQKYVIGDLLLAVWPGQWSSDTFIVDLLEAAKMIGYGTEEGYKIM